MKREYAIVRGNDIEFQLLQIPIRDWNQQITESFISLKYFNYYKSLLGIETKSYLFEQLARNWFQLLQIPIRDWNLLQRYL